MQTAMTSQQAFAARIARINSKAVNTNATLYVGMDEVHLLRDGIVKRKKPKSGPSGWTILMFMGMAGLGSAVGLREGTLEQIAAVLPPAVGEKILSANWATLTASLSGML